MLKQIASDISGDMVTGTSSIKQEASQVMEKAADAVASKSEYLIVRLFGTPSTGAKGSSSSEGLVGQENLDFNELTKKKPANGK